MRCDDPSGYGTWNVPATLSAFRLVASRFRSAYTGGAIAYTHSPKVVVMFRLGFGSLLVVCAVAGCNAKPPADTKAGSSASASSAATVAAAAPAAPVRPINTAEVDLFNGKDLSGWVVTECETEVKDGVLLLKAGEGWVRTENKYADFVLSWECKNLKPDAYDSGLHFRAELPTGKAHWPKKFQVNLKTGGEGNITTIKDAASTGLYKNGEWNAFKLTVRGNKAELEINGQPAWTTEGIDTAEGYIGLQSEVTLGGQFEFRNIKIKELSSK